MNSSAYSLDDCKQSCSWPLGVSLPKAFTDEVRNPHLFRIGRERIVQQLKRH